MKGASLACEEESRGSVGELGGMLYSLRGYEFLKILELKCAVKSPRGQSTIPTPAKNGTGLF